MYSSLLTRESGLIESHDYRSIQKDGGLQAYMWETKIGEISVKVNLQCSINYP